MVISCCVCYRLAVVLCIVGLCVVQDAFVYVLRLVTLDAVYVFAVKINSVSLHWPCFHSKHDIAS